MDDTSSPISTNSGPDAYTGGGGRSHRILIVLFLIYMSDYADRMVVSSMIDFIKRDWHITDAQAGWLISVVVLFITVFTIPAAILIDRWSRRKMVALMTFFWSIATLACAFTKNYTQLIITRAFIGIGESGYAPGGSAMIAAAYPEKDRAKYMGIWNASIPLGVGIGLAAGGLIAKRWGWHHAFGIVALPGMLLAIAAWYLPDYKSVRPEDSATGLGEDRGFSGFIKQSMGILRIPSLTCTYLGFAMNVSATTALMTWLPTYFERVGKAEPGKGGVYSSALFALVLIGAPLGGYLSDILQRKHKKARMIFPAVSSVAATILLYVSFLNIDKPYALGLLALYGITVTCFVAPGAAVTQDVVHPGLRAFSYGMCVIVQHVLGDIWSPPLIGKISDMIGLENAVLFVPVYGALGAVFFLIGSRFYERDLSRVEKVQLQAE